MLIDVMFMAATFVIALLVTPWVRRVATARQVLDRPGVRSSHSRPTPRLGGVSIVVAFNIAVFALLVMRLIDTSLALALIGGGLLVAVIGALDDRGSVPVAARITVHFAAAAWAVYILKGAPLHIGSWTLNDGVLSNALTIVSIVWALNLFNFMDGIDGIAASEAACITLGGGTIAAMSGELPSIAPAVFSLSGASLGFLMWNWQPAKIFMGDVGSGYLGYCIAVLALSMARQGTEAIPVWLILGGVFFVDATVTVLRRLARREALYEAHRIHAYQWLARRWRSHQCVTLTVIGFNIIWLFPCALFAARNARHEVTVAACALIPLVVAALAAGAGRKETVLREPGAHRNCSETNKSDEWPA
jgi:Fuc2NAc and GlcNAc transferase